VQPVADNVRGNCGGINGFGEGGPEGVAAVPIMSGCEQPTIAVTTDSGLTWDLRKLPNQTGVQVFDPEVQFDEAGNLYLIWRGSDQHTYVARSPDHGETWTQPWDITPPSVGPRSSCPSASPAAARWGPPSWAPRTPIKARTRPPRTPAGTSTR